MKVFTASLILILLTSLAAPCSADTIIPVTEDVMTSSFFTGTDLVRGYPGDARPTLRVSTNDPFGLGGAETVYLTFNYDFSTFSGPVPSAVLTVASVAGGFNADAGPGNPFLISAHGVTADPLSSITDDTNPSGPISWNSFFSNNILAAPAAAHTSVTGFGPLQFDVTALVNSWIGGTNTVFAIALTGKNDISSNDFLHGIANDTQSVGTTSYLTVQAVPEPSSVVMMVLGIALCAGAKWRTDLTAWLRR